MLNIDRFPKPVDGHHWVVSKDYPVNLSPVSHKEANVFGVLPANLDKVFDHEASVKIVRDERLLSSELSMLYRSDPSEYWLVQLSWSARPNVLVVSNEAIQRYIAIAKVPADLKECISGPINGYKGLLKFPSVHDPAYKLVGVQVPDSSHKTL